MHLFVLFDEPFWVGLVLAERDGVTHLYRHVFGSEPTDPEVTGFVRHDLIRLLSREPAGLVCEPEPRFLGATAAARRRFVRDALETPALTPAIRVALEERRSDGLSAARARARRAAEDDGDRKRALARQKARDRHRGR